MVYHGTVRGGVVVFPPNVHLAEGLNVTVQPVATPTTGHPFKAPSPQVRNGVPIFRRTDPNATIDLELVNKLRDESP
jgi:hypothetical protein